MASFWAAGLRTERQTCSRNVSQIFKSIRRFSEQFADEGPLFRAEKTMTATDVTGFDAIFSTGFFATFSRF